MKCVYPQMSKSKKFSETVRYGIASHLHTYDIGIRRHEYTNDETNS
jgi:hypothetical protein